MIETHECHGGCGTRVRSTVKRCSACEVDERSGKRIDALMAELRRRRKENTDLKRKLRIAEHKHKLYDAELAIAERALKRLRANRKEQARAKRKR